jgi:hypothetical protein
MVITPVDIQGDQQENKSRVLHRVIKQYDKEKSALAEHKFEDGDHTFDLEKTVVLAKTTKYHQTLIREAIEIRKKSK